MKWREWWNGGKYVFFKFEEESKLKRNQIEMNKNT